MADVARDYSALVGRPAGKVSPLRPLFTALTASLSAIFLGMCWFFYWFMAIPAAITSLLLPRSVLVRGTIFWLTGASVAIALLTQTTEGFFPNYAHPTDVLDELGVWFSLGFFARVYLIYTQIPDTFEGLRESIASRPIDRWFASVLPNPIDAIFVRIWLASTIGIIPVSVVLMLPWTINYLAIVGYCGVLLLVQFPLEVTDHTNIHNRIFNPKPDASPRTKAILDACRINFDYVLTLLAARVPDHYRIQHVYIHHVEDNGPDDTQTTMAYDRTSFLDFSRHAFWQGLDLITGYAIIPYLRKKDKTRQLREFVRGLSIWYAFIIVITLFNPVASGLIVLSRFLGGNILSFIAFYQHGLVIASDVYDVHGNTVDYHFTEHGNLGDDFHVEHHLKPARHWSKFRETFDQGAQKPGGHGAVILNKEMFTPLAFIGALWGRDYETVARYAKLNEDNGATIAEMVHARTRPIGDRERAGALARFDALVSRIAAWAVLSSFQRWDLSRANAPTHPAT
jgi:fatty acid desaturase